jgi:hypothetical protein
VLKEEYSEKPTCMHSRIVVGSRRGGGEEKLHCESRGRHFARCSRWAGAELDRGIREPLRQGSEQMWWGVLLCTSGAHHFL